MNRNNIFYAMWRSYTISTLIGNRNSWPSLKRAQNSYCQIRDQNFNFFSLGIRKNENPGFAILLFFSARGTLYLGWRTILSKKIVLQTAVNNAQNSKNPFLMILGSPEIEKSIPIPYPIPSRLCHSRGWLAAPRWGTGIWRVSTPKVT